MKKIYIIKTKFLDGMVIAEEAFGSEHSRDLIELHMNDSDVKEIAIYKKTKNKPLLARHILIKT